MKVKDIMTTDIVTVKPDMQVNELADLFIKRDISGAPVVDDQGKLLGVVLEEGLITRDKKVHLPTFVYMLSGFVEIGAEKFDEDMRRAAAITVEGILDRSPSVLSPEDQIEDVATSMVEEGKRYFLVKDGDRLAGVVTKKDIIRAIAQGKIS
jgi:CBS domain-containing protein